MKERELLRLEGVKKSFGDVCVLKGIDLSVNEGEFITILGSSGCGKTTLLRIIAGLEDIDEGSLYLNGMEVSKTEPNKRNVPMVFQNYALFPHMNVESNIGYSLRLRRTDREVIRRAVSEVLELVQLSGYEKRRPNELSGGQRQRVAVARALINRPSILLLDEPLGALDLQLRRQMQMELKRLQEQLKITFIYITHDQEEALSMSDRIAVMRNGVFEQIGTATEIYNKPETSYVARFVGDANIIKNDNEFLAIRSEHIEISPVEGSLTGPGGAEGCLRARIIARSFVGGRILLTAKVENGDEITAWLQGMDNTYHTGMDVLLGWAPGNAVPVINTD
ncbi:MAG: ABC transporter ATP-binding protein [Treponema sp.]|nr:ABC transporter ATP-binding protein [Treponema sp.]